MSSYYTEKLFDSDTILFTNTLNDKKGPNSANNTHCVTSAIGGFFFFTLKGASEGFKLLYCTRKVTGSMLTSCVLCCRALEQDTHGSKLA